MRSGHHKPDQGITSRRPEDIASKSDDAKGSVSRFLTCLYGLVPVWHHHFGTGSGGARATAGCAKDWVSIFIILSQGCRQLGSLAH